MLLVCGQVQYSPSNTFSFVSLKLILLLFCTSHHRPFLPIASACRELRMDPHDDELPPHPLPPNVVLIGAEDAVANEPPPADKPTDPKKLPMARPGLGKKGVPIQLLANHYKVSVKSSEDFFHHYHVSTYMLPLLHNLVC